MSREPYTPPTGDEPLDAVDLVLVRMWVKVISRMRRERLLKDQHERAASREGAHEA